MMAYFNPDQRKGLMGSALLSLMILAIVGAYYIWGETYHARILYATFVNLLVVVGLQVFTGNANITGFSHAAFMGIAAYIAAICVTPAAMKLISLPDAPWGLNAFELSALVSATIALVITGLMGLATGLIIVRLSGVGVTITSIALLVIVHSIFLHRTDIFKGNQAFSASLRYLICPILPDWSFWQSLSRACFAKVRLDCNCALVPMTRRERVLSGSMCVACG